MDQARKTQLRYITGIFPLVDIPFAALVVIYSQNWLLSLCLFPVFPVIASLVMYVSSKKGLYPGWPILIANGIFFFFYLHMSGPDSPTWLFLINITIGSTFMFRRPLEGQICMVVVALSTGLVYYLIGADPGYCILISASLIAEVALFGRAFSYMQIQHRSIEQKTRELEEKNRDITDSIQYAQRIQKAVLPVEEVMVRAIPLHFVMYHPKDIVSGDFYWFHQLDRERYILVCGDCTGHGVPGALMTVIGTSLLNQIVVESGIHAPARILSELDTKLTHMLRQQSERFHSVSDGMDMSLILADTGKRELKFAGAKRPGLHFRNGVLTELKADKTSIGGMRSGEKFFHETTVQMNQDDVLVLYTDGITDQFGGEKGKKYSSRRFREFMRGISGLTIPLMLEKAEGEYASWRGDIEQLDDICVIGIRF